MNRLEKRQQFLKEFIEKGTQLHNGKYDYSNVDYINSRTKVNIICPIHGVFEQKADSHIRGNGCRLCGLESENRNFPHDWSPEQREKIRQTCLERYGAERYLELDLFIELNATWLHGKH